MATGRWVEARRIDIFTNQRDGLADADPVFRDRRIEQFDAFVLTYIECVDRFDIVEEIFRIINDLTAYVRSFDRCWLKYIFLSANTTVGESSMIKARVSSRAFTRCLRLRSPLTTFPESEPLSDSNSEFPKVERILSNIPTVAPYSHYKTETMVLFVA